MRLIALSIVVLAGAVLTLAGTNSSIYFANGRLSDWGLVVFFISLFWLVVELLMGIDIDKKDTRTDDQHQSK